MSTLRQIATDRRNIHKNHASSRPLSEDYEFIGLVGEGKFAEEFGLTMDEDLRPGGDAGRDFITCLGRIDVKTAAKPYYLIVEQGKVRADVYVLARYHAGAKTATLLGWAYKEQVLRAPVRDFGYGVISHYIPEQNLLGIGRLRELLAKAPTKARRGEDIF